MKRFVPSRELGRTGFSATMLGIGDLADRRIALAELVATARRAMDAGLNVIDTAPGYEDGYSELVVGQAIKGRRESLFVIDKIDHHDEPVAGQMEESLRRLEIDCADLFVFHGVSSPEGWGKLTTPGSGMEQLDKCIKAGKARFRGISSHDPDTLAAAIASGLCDVVMFPVGPYVDRRYVEEILPLARRQKVGTVCFKTFGAGKLLGDTLGYNQPLQDRPRGKLSSGGLSESGSFLPRLTVSECVQYTLTCNPDVALLGLSFANEQDAAFAAAEGFTAPLPPEAMETIRRHAEAAIADKGPCWWNPGGA